MFSFLRLGFSIFGAQGLRKRGENFGLVGTITLDFISLSSGQFFSGLGGILYQAAALCGLGKKVHLFSNLGQELWPLFTKVTANWLGCGTEGICVGPGPGNRVHLCYPQRGERVEVLESCVPPLDPQGLIEEASRFDFLIAVLNSGRDFILKDWRRIVKSVGVPIWLDIHSLPLSFILNKPRSYEALPAWKDWVEGVTYLQANEREVASMLGELSGLPSRARIKRLGEEALELGPRTVFITLGKKGVLVLAPGTSRVIEAPTVRGVVDTTGCGDVFCAATAAALAEGASPLEAARRGVRLATRVARVAGVEKTYELIRNLSGRGSKSS